jgi:hypothetical protein
MGLVIIQNMEIMGETFRAFLSGQEIILYTQTKLLIWEECNSVSKRRESNGRNACALGDFQFYFLVPF